MSLAIAQSGLRVGPGIDKGYGKANAVVLDIRKASDRRTVWALDAIIGASADSSRHSMHLLGSDCALDTSARLRSQ